MEKNSNINYEDYIGREVKGFKFEDSDMLPYNPTMDEYIGRVGSIGTYHEEDGIFTVEFYDDFWHYPADLVIKQLEQKESLVEMMEKDEEAGIYDSSDDDDDSTPDLVNNPPHYTTGRIEVIDFIEDKELDFLEGNIIKYTTRYKKKNGLEDLKKAQWYLNKLIERVENNGV